jgi:hypothetical protein
MTDIKQFLTGAVAAGLLGLYAYSGAKQDNHHLMNEMRQQKVENAASLQEARDLLLQVTELEYDNAKSYKEITDTTKRYSEIILGGAKNGTHGNIEEMVELHRALDRCSQKICQNNRTMLESIQAYCEPEQKSEEF